MNMKKNTHLIKMVLGAGFLLVSLGAFLYQLPKKYNDEGFKINAKNYLAKGGLLQDIEDEYFWISESGDAEFKGRSIKGAVVRATFTIIDRKAGEKRKVCYNIPALFDKEFDMYRSITLIECGKDENTELAQWKLITNAYFRKP